jgi:hypothetical protein
MARKKVVKVRIYTVHWYSNGFCYRTTRGCDMDAVKNCKCTAKLLGETIKYELERIETYEY